MSQHIPPGFISVNFKDVFLGEDQSPFRFFDADILLLVLIHCFLADLEVVALPDSFL